MKQVAKLLGITALFLIAVLVVASMNQPAQVFATKEIYAAAKDKFGKDIKGCKHCHVKALPKEDSADLNERGTWLMKQKEEKGADAIDVAWLADYPG